MSNVPDIYQPDEKVQAILQRQADTPLQIGMFEGREGQAFTLVDGDTRVPLELANAERIPPQKGAPCQEPGSLVFEADAEWNIAQRLYLIEHEELGELVLFLVPIMNSESEPTETLRLRLQTVFN